MPSYTWIPNIGGTGRYRDDSTGRFVSPDAVRGELDNYLANSNDPIKALAEQLREGRVNVADWQTAMMREIKNAHLNAVATAVGGYENMTAVEYGRAGGIIGNQYQYLANFADEIASGKQRLDGTLDRRMQMYIDAARETYYRQKQAMVSGTATHIRSMLNPADHCSQCVDLNGVWFEIGGNYVAIGERICRKNCKCSEEYGRLDASGQVATIGVA